VYHQHRITFGYPSHQSVGLDKLNLSGLTEVGSKKVSTRKALARLVPPQP